MATITSIKDKINQLDQAGFQILCDKYLSKKGYPNLVCLGTKDGEQKTTPGTPDTYFCMRDKKYIFAEYTTQTTGSLVFKIREDIEKCLDVSYTHIELSDILEIVYCHTSSNIKPQDDQELKRMCEKHGIQLTLFGIDALAEGLMEYPSIVKDHLGLTIDTEQIQNVEDFVKQYNSNSLAATLDTQFLAREKELDEIEEAFTKENVVLLSGPAGVGKTRLALEYARRRTAGTNEKLFCIHDRALPLYNDLKTYFEQPDRYFMFVDDANQLSEIKHVIEFTNKTADGYQVKVLITVRDYALQKVKTDISDIVKYEIVNIKKLEDEKIEKLMKEHYGIVNQRYLDRIVMIAEGNARIAMLAGKIASDSNRLDSINDVTQLYADYYGKSFHEAGLDTDQGLLTAAGIMAFLNVVHLDYIDAILPILEQKGLSRENFKTELKRLHEFEIVDIYYDKAVRFSEQCLANFILKYVFFDNKFISLADMIEACFNPYRERTIHAINTLLGVFQNTTLHSYVENEVIKLWAKLQKENSPDFWEYVKVFCLINPLEALLIIQNRINELPENEIPPEEIDTEKGKNCQSVSDDFITILGSIANTDNLEAALDLFFQYYLKRPDLYMQFYHASETYFSVQRDSSEHGFNIQIKYLEKIIEYSDTWNNPYIVILFFHIAKIFLKLNFSPCESNRKDRGITVYQIPLSDQPGVQKYRKIIWEQLLSLSLRQNYKDEILEILNGYERGMEECSKAVVRFDAPYICKLITTVLKEDCLSDCLLVRALDGIFDIAEYKTDILNCFLHNHKMELYSILKGPTRVKGEKIEERKLQRGQKVVDYLDASNNRIEVINELLSIYEEFMMLKKNNDFELSESIKLIIREVSNNKKDFKVLISRILNMRFLYGVDVFFVVQKLFEYFNKESVFQIITYNCEYNKNQWLFAYYHELPIDYVNENELQGLYNFLKNDSDRAITFLSYRSIDFLEKFLPVDPNIFIKSAHIIFDKRTYDPHIVDAYLSFQFNEYSIKAEKVIDWYRNDIDLLEKIYLYIEQKDINLDYNGKFLYELYLKDHSFILRYIDTILKNDRNYDVETFSSKLCIFYYSELYIEIFDAMLSRAISRMDEYGQFSLFFTIIKSICMLPEEYEFCKEKRDQWIEHYITVNCKNMTRMKYLFEAISEISMEQIPKYIKLFCSHNDDFDDFEDLPLTPSSYGWSGSAVPMYTAWISGLESLLPLFPGLKYLRHKKRVEDMIAYVRNRIREAEISEIIEG